MAKNLYIIDGHAHIYSAYFAPMRQQLTSPSGEPTKATYIFTNMLLGLLQRYQPEMLVVTMDSKGPTFRHEFYDQYKANRSPMPEDMPVQIARIEQILEALDVPVIRLDRFEADDLMGTLSRAASEAGVDCTLCSKDKDLLQLLGPHTQMLDVKKDVFTTVESLMQEKGITPAQFLEVLALQGDTSDNIPGIPDVGPKTALDWIRQYGSMEELFSHADEIKGKRGESLRSSRELADLSKRLVTIDCHVPIEIEWDCYSVTPVDRDRLLPLFEELGFQRLLGQLGMEGSDGGAVELAGPSDLTTIEHDYQLIDTVEALEALAEKLSQQEAFAIDTETTSVQAMRADLVGISLAWEPHQGFYLPVRGPLGAQVLPMTEVRRVLAPILSDTKSLKVGQNLKYDLLILENAGLPLAGPLFDTMVASYCLDPLRSSHSMDALAQDLLNYRCVSITELIGKGKKQRTFDTVDTVVASDYAAEDADVTWQLYGLFKQRLSQEPSLQKLFDELEMPLVSVLTRMEYHGVALDEKLLRKMSGLLNQELDIVSDEVFAMAETVFNIDSPKQLGEILFDKLGLPSKRKGKTGRSTDAAVLESLKPHHPIADRVLYYRQLNKLKNTYVDKLGGLVNNRTGRIHTSFNQTVTATGRLSSSDPNLQNIPIRTDLGREIRGAFVAGDSDHLLVSADYSQVELRLLAHFSQDPALLEAFATDQDIHRFVASQIYGIDPDEVTSEMRSHCKAVNFGIIYGQGAFGLSQTTGLSMGEAKRFIEDYYARYESIRGFMDGVIESAEKLGYVETLLGRRRAIEDMRSKNKQKRSQAERFAVNTVIQGSAADLIKVAMIKIHERIEGQELPVKMILQVHDELVFEVPKESADEQVRWIEQEMVTAMDLRVPLKVDANVGPTWSKD